ncbi:MAG: polysaccharide deacetylase family protein [Eubacteriales bacterium]
MIQFDRYKDGKKHILTMSYDDGHDTDRKLVEIFNKNGIKGTFYINSGTLKEPKTINKAELAELYRGHEVAVHTVSHPHLERMPLQNVVQEVIQDRQNLEQLCGYPVRGMSFPYSTYNDDVLNVIKSCGIVYSRTANSTNNFGFPTNFLTWNPTCHHNNNLIAMGKRFLDDNNFPWRSDLFYVWGHSYEFNNDNNWDIIETFCEQIAGHEQVWYATNIEIFDYITAQKNLQLSVDNKIIYNPSVQTVWFSNDEETIEIKGGETIKL